MTREHPARIEARIHGSQLPPADAIARRAGAAASLYFTGPHGPLDANSLEALRRACDTLGVKLSADFVLDDDADAIAALGAQPTTLRGVLEASRGLRQAGVPVRWWIPIADPIAYRLESLFSLASDEGVDAILTPAAMVEQHRAAASLDHESRRFVRDFIAYRLLDEDKGRQPAVRLEFYEAVLGSLDEHAGDVAWPRETVAILQLDDRGNWAEHTEERAALTRLVDAPPDRTVRQHTGESPREVAGVLAEGLRAIAQWSLTALAGRSVGRGTSTRKMEKVLVIGAYGGDHIGDTAIVGGVLLRIHERYHAREALLMSQRPEHTRRLANMLDLPVAVTVHEYRQSIAADLLERVDGVVFAGGPLMDLPKQLVKHLYTVAVARRAGKPFVIEGIGAGPFIRTVSAWTARLLVRMAERITVRTEADARQPLVRGLDPIVGRDPAFDYLETRREALTRIADADARWLDRLFERTEGRTTIGINLRPLRPDYTVGAPAAQRAEYTRQVEARFEERLAEALTRFHRASPTAPCFIFYPMNAIQFGSSDLRSAYRLKRRLAPEIDLRVWEGDPSIDAVVALLRRVDIAITMRFHATIYALSQGTKVIGVDYRPGKKDKVAALLEDVGQGDRCRRIDEMTADWMFETLVELSQPARITSAARPRRTAGSSLRPVQRPVPT